jgi:hypothetical protein
MVTVRGGSGDVRYARSGPVGLIGAATFAGGTFGLIGAATFAGGTFGLIGGATFADGTGRGADCSTKRPSSIRSGARGSARTAGATTTGRGDASSVDAGKGSGLATRMAGRTGVSGLNAGGRASGGGADATSVRTGTRFGATGPPLINAAPVTAVRPPGTRQFA